MKQNEDRVLEIYRGLLDRINRNGGSKELLRMHAEARCVPFNLGSDHIHEHANQKMLKVLKPSFTDDLRKPMLKIVEDFAHDVLRTSVRAAWAHDLAAFFLTPVEAAGVERAMRAVTKVYDPLRVTIFDSYRNSPDGYRRQRDLAIIWDGFATMNTWTDRIRSIRSVLNEPTLRPVGVTQREIDADAIPGLTSRIRGRYVATSIPPETQSCSSCGARLLENG
jgi:hypothetical protein